MPSNIQWTLAYLATTEPNHGQISEIAGHVSHHVNSVYIDICNVSLLALSFLFLSCYPSSVKTDIASESRNFSTSFDHSSLY